MARPHKYAWNGLDAETALSIETIANMAQRAASESTGDPLNGKQRIVSSGSTDRAIEFRINDFLISFNKLLVFTLRFTESGARVFASTSIDWYLTTQSTVAGFIPVSAKTMTAHHTFMQFVRNLAGQISAADPTARIVVREGVHTDPATAPAAASSVAAMAARASVAPTSDNAIAGAVSVPFGAPSPPAEPPPPPPRPPLAPLPSRAVGSPVPASAVPARALPVSPPTRTPSGVGGGLVTAIPGIGTSKPAAPAPPPPASAPPPLQAAPPPPPALSVNPLAAQMFSDDDDDLEATRIGQASGNGGSWLLALSDGRQVPLTASPVVFGRGPVAPSTHPDAVPTVVVDSNMSVSKTHALVSIDGGMLWVTDMHSTNGTKVTNELGEATSCPPGVAMPTGNGWTISLGEYSMQVVLAKAAGETHA